MYDRALHMFPAGNFSVSRTGASPAGRGGNILQSTAQWKRRFLISMATLLIALLAVVSATFAWYIYNSSAHTTRVKMAAGTSTKLQIASSYDGEYSSSTVMEAFTGKLNPVSTNRILLGFRKVAGFTNGTENQPLLVANLFKSAETADYYKTSLFLRTNGAPVKVYLSDVGYDDDSDANPISTAIRLGLVVHQPGRDGAEDKEYIFAINPDHNINAPSYNTYTGKDGYVLDLTSSDTEAVVEFEPYTADQYCKYDKNTGETELKAGSLPLFTLSGSTDASGQYTGYGESVQVDVYIWLEGCDQDCTNDLVGATLKVLSLSFAGIS